jgi:DNA-binding IclR family transcriptional regulator
MRVLRAYGNKPRGGGVREIARELDMSKSTLQRITASLAEARFLAYDLHTETYSLGPAVLELAADYHRTSNLTLAASEPLSTLWRRTDETACLYTKVDLSSVCLLQFESPHALRFTGQLGRPVSLTLGASGRVLMSLLPDADLDVLLPTLEPEPEGQEALRRAVLAVREQGVAITRGEVTPGGTAVAVPVCMYQESPLAVFLYAPDSRMPPERIEEVVPLLQETANAIAIGLTGRAPQ